MMAAIIYTLCAVTSLLCAVLLLRAYSTSRYRLLFWSGVFFSGVTINNLLLVVDKLIYPDFDLLSLRLGLSLIALLFFLYGLIFDE